jgi:hypothetical protein
MLRVSSQQRRSEIEGAHDGVLFYWTTTVPVILGWIEQKYL